jgi:hypothetical protein
VKAAGFPLHDPYIISRKNVCCRGLQQAIGGIADRKQKTGYSISGNRFCSSFS